jgi:poly(3-hydroxybutyrate) depolymerase
MWYSWIKNEIMNNTNIIKFGSSELDTKNSHPEIGRYLKSSIQTKNQNVLQYFVRMPKHYSKDSKLLILVHGITRKPLQMLSLLAKDVDKHQPIMVAPLFDRQTWRGYQQLNCMHSKERADNALLSVISDLTETLDLQKTRCNLVGFSGGGQFAHRFAFAHPDRIEKLVTISAGWYTHPDNQLQYPYGTKTDNNHGITFLDKPYSSHTLALVGDNDIHVDSSLNMDPRIIEIQGLNRVERAKKWISALREYAEGGQNNNSIRLKIMKDVGHSFRQCMLKGGLGAEIEKFLFMDRRYGV